MTLTVDIMKLESEMKSCKRLWIQALIKTDRHIPMWRLDINPFSWIQHNVENMCLSNLDYKTKVAQNAEYLLLL